MSSSSYILSPPATPQSQMMAYEASIATGDGYASGGTPDNPFYSAQSSMIHLPPTIHSPIETKVKIEADLLPPIGLATAPYVMPRKVDMGFPSKGTEAAKAGIQTPLAQYTSQMVSWLWFGRYTPPRYHPDGTPIVSDPFECPPHPTHALHPRQVAPAIEFERFVDRVLYSTQVSHSVVLVSLLYIYRLKNRYHIEAGAGTEMRAFVAGLILANKYLDDNTYTTKTWAELTGLPLREVCRMEVEFLRGLEYRLCVSKNDYTTWRHLLDGFILSRSTGTIYRSRFNPSFHGPGSPSNHLITPATSYLPSHPYSAYTDVRARSVSPQTAATYSPSLRYYTPKDDHTYGSATTGNNYGYGRKRSAVDAFAGEFISQATVYESMRRPQRKAHARAHAEPASAPGTGSMGLVRSSSCNRQIARLPGSASSGVGRRGSAGNMQGTHVQESDLRHTAANHAAYLTYEQSKGKENVPDAGEGWWSTLVAPCDQYPEAHVIPPEHMTFYTVAATPHVGQDGAPRKAILRHQDPHPYSYPPQYQPYVDPSTISGQGWAHIDEHADDISPTAYIPTSTSQYLEPSYEAYYPSDNVYPGTGPVESEPAQFANAGPPGYAYDPTAIYSNGVGYEGGLQGQEINRWSTTSEEMALAYAHAYGHTGSISEQCKARSEWSSPLPGYEWRRV